MKSWGALAALRWLVGMSEAFVITGTIMYVSFWYKYDEIALRAAIFFSTWAISGVFNGLISYAIMHHLEGKNGWKSWQWIFLIEGVSSRRWIDTKDISKH